MRDLRALWLGGSIAPQLRRTHRLVISAKRHEAVLLPADADPGDLCFVTADLLQALAHGGIYRVNP